jgi:hypothetical protein
MSWRRRGGMPAASQKGEQRERRRRGDKKKCFGFGEKDILKFLEILQLLPIRV